MENFIYPVTVTKDKEDEGFVVTFPDLPEAITQGDDIKDALVEAVDCLEEAIANRIVMNLPIPYPSHMSRERCVVALPIRMAAKAALYKAICELNISKPELARRLRFDETEIDCMLNPKHSTELNKIESALAAVGRQLVVGFQAAV